MRHLARTLALAVCVVLVGSVAEAAPRHRHHHKVAKKKAKHREKVAKHHHDDEDSDQVALADEPDVDVDATRDDEEEIDAPAKVTKHRAKKRATDWHFAVGPNIWAASVDAKVALGGGNDVGAGVDFLKLGRYTKYAVPMLAEARYGRFSLVGDLTYAVMGLEGMNQVGPFNVALDGTVASLQLDSFAGVRLIGGDHSPVTIEARGGLRYSRTSINAAVGVAGTAVTPPEQVMQGADALAGARVFLRPTEHFGLSGAADVGVFGDSTRTWSAGIDANARIGSHVLISLGWKTMTTESSYINIVMHGPKAAVLVAF